jgi:hypothetical protein
MKQPSPAKDGHQGGPLTKTDAAPGALATVDEIRALLQAAQFAAGRLELLTSERLLCGLSAHIHSVRLAADSVRAQLQGAAYTEPGRPISSCLKGFSR